MYYTLMNRGRRGLNARIVSVKKYNVAVLYIAAHTITDMKSYYITINVCYGIKTVP